VIPVGRVDLAAVGAVDLAAVGAGEVAGLGVVEVAGLGVVEVAGLGVVEVPTLNQTAGSAIWPGPRGRIFVAVFVAVPASSGESRPIADCT
jgi:hypothetical protein